MASPVRQFNADIDQERLLDIVRTLVCELGRQSALASVGPAAHLDRELGLGSLERVELLLRLEKTFGARLDEQRSGRSRDGPGPDRRALCAPRGIPQPRARKWKSRRGLSAISSSGIAEGIPAAETFQDVLRYRGSRGRGANPSDFFRGRRGKPLADIRRISRGSRSAWRRSW